MYDQNLITYLEAHPECKFVYMNDKGGWLLHSRPDFPNEVSRETIVGKAKTASTETKLPDTSKNK